MEKYLKGTMNDVVYPVNGGLEDWAYAAGWENEYSGEEVVVPPCRNLYDLKGEEKKYLDTNQSHIRSVLFLVECGDPKDPKEEFLGKSEGMIRKGWVF